MPELVEQMYCSQQIVIPPKFPYILKRYCKAAIKTQPYDLLRWSFEYFKALAERRAPPVKLRLEYPVYSTEGGLTRGCLKVLANQLRNMKEIPLPVLKAAWQGFCLDPGELRRVICLCNCYLREETVPFLHFIAVAGGLLTKNLTHTMILLCETLTKEPDGGSAAIPLDDFLAMYLLLARMDASKDVRFVNGYREGETPQPESIEEEEEEPETVQEEDTGSIDDYWHEGIHSLKRVSLIDDAVATNTRISVRMTMPILGKIERSPSMEREGMIERENYLRERKGRAQPDDEVEQKLRELSSAGLSTTEKPKEEVVKKEEKVEKPKDWIEIIIADEDGNIQPLEFYGESKHVSMHLMGEEEIDEVPKADREEEEEQEEEVKVDEKERVEALMCQLYKDREDRLVDLEQTFIDISAIVDRFKSASYDLGMVAGRQMSTTSGEFIVQHIEREIMDYIDEQIAILPDPDLKKKKAKPEEVAMIRELLETFLDENMELIVPEIEEVEEEEQPIPDVIVVYAVPGIGPIVPEEMVVDIEEYVLDVCKVQADLIMPRNLRHFMCPPLEKFEEYKYDDYPKQKEELPNGEAFTT